MRHCDECYAATLSHFSCVQLFATLCTAARQAPLSMGFSRQECWSWLPFLTLGDLPNQGTELESLVLPAWQVILYLWATWETPRLQYACSIRSDSLQPHGLKPTRLLCPWHSPGKNTGMDSQSFLRGIFQTQGSNPHMLRCRQILHGLSQ